MSKESAFDYTPQLKQLMQTVGCSSLSDLARRSGLSRTSVNRIRQGHLLDLPLGKVLQLSQFLEVDFESLIAQFSGEASVDLRRQEPEEQSDQKISVNTLKKSQNLEQENLKLQQAFDQLEQEYDRQQQQLQTQQEQLWAEQQKSIIHILESLLLQWPTAAYAARKNPDAPAVKLLPLMRPLEQLLEAWNISPIGEVGAEIVYDPQWHQVMPISGKTPRVGDRVLVRYVGYRQGEQLLYRAKVSPS